VIDLRAHFEAQLRRVARAEEALVKCRAARDTAAFEASAAALRHEVQIVSDNNRSVRPVIDQMSVDARELTFPARSRKTGDEMRRARVTDRQEPAR
jgi:hypothetical protein